MHINQQVQPTSAGRAPGGTAGPGTGPGTGRYRWSVPVPLVPPSPVGSLPYLRHFASTTKRGRIYANPANLARLASGETGESSAKSRQTHCETSRNDGAIPRDWGVACRHVTEFYFILLRSSTQIILYRTVPWYNRAPRNSIAVACCPPAEQHGRGESPLHRESAPIRPLIRVVRDCFRRSATTSPLSLLAVSPPSALATTGCTRMSGKPLAQSTRGSTIWVVSR